MYSIAERILVNYYSLPIHWDEYTEYDEEIYMKFVHPFLLFQSKLIDKIPDDVMKSFVIASSQAQN